MQCGRQLSFCVLPITIDPAIDWKNDEEIAASTSTRQTRDNGIEPQYNGDGAATKH